MPIAVRHRPVPTRPPVRFKDPSGIALVGMQGMGDNLHQRAIVRDLMAQGTVYLQTPWPCVYHDLVGPRLQLVATETTLRTQRKNAAREGGSYAHRHMPQVGRYVRVWYTPDDVRGAGSVLRAMLRATGTTGTNFRLPIPEAWRAAVWSRFLGTWPEQKPLMVYRPLVERTEWGGCANRNPDLIAYYNILQAIRDYFFVVSIADLVPGKEWISGVPIQADVELHHGELTFEMLAALVADADLVFASPGFATILAQAVGTPSVCVFGGYENSSSFSTGAAFAPYLGIDPITPCSCFSHVHACRKAIDVPRAIERVRKFIKENVCQ